MNASKNPLRICMLTPQYPPDFGWYGAGRDSLELSIELLDRGHSVDIIACTEGRSTGETFQDGMKVTRVVWKNDGHQGSLVAHTLPKTRLLLNMNYALWQAYLEAVQESDYDIVDVCGSSAESLVPSIMAECPVFARVYEKHPRFLEKELVHLGSGGFKFESHLENALSVISSSFADALSSVSQKPSGPERSPEELHRHSYCLDTSHFSPHGPPALDTKSRPAVLVHTSIRNPKYKELLSDILAKLKKEIADVWLTVVAHDIYSEDSETQLKQELAESGIVCDMVVNHNMARLLMPGLWRSSRCGLILDWENLAPYAVLEPLSCGRPVVVESHTADMGFLKQPDLIPQLKEFTAACITEKLAAYLRNEEECGAAGARAREYIVANHCRAQSADQIIQAYQSAIARFNETRKVSKVKRMEKLLSLCQTLSVAGDQLLYDLLFVRSVRFRVSHWLKKLKGAPMTEPHKDSLNKLSK